MENVSQALRLTTELSLLASYIVYQQYTVYRQTDLIKPYK